MAKIEINFTQSKAGIRSLEAAKGGLQRTLVELNSAKSKAASIDRTVKNIDIYRQNIDREVKIIKTDLDTLGRFVKDYRWCSYHWWNNYFGSDSRKSSFGRSSNWCLYWWWYRSI